MARLPFAAIPAIQGERLARKLTLGCPILLDDDRRQRELPHAVEDVQSFLNNSQA